MKLSLAKDLTRTKADAVSKVNAEAQAVCANYITIGAAQSMIYERKEQQAQQVSANPGINPSLVGLVAIDAVRYGVSLLDAATTILIKAHEWTTLAPLVEDKRLRAQDAIAVATSPAAITEAATVDWSMPA